MDEQTLGFDDLFAFPRDRWGFSYLGGLLEREAQTNGQMCPTEWGQDDLKQQPIDLAQAQEDEFLQAVHLRSDRPYPSQRPTDSRPG